MNTPVVNSNCTSVIQLTDIALSLPIANGSEIQILNGINLEVPSGSRCGLIGPSGSGKTSLLTIIAGLRQPSRGKVTVMDNDYTSCDEESLATFRRDNIGVVFQNFHLLPSMTALENAAMPLELANDPEAESKAEEALKLVGLGHRLDHLPHQLSGGEQQRTAIARAFVGKPALVLADEPTGNLDEQTSGAVMEILYSMTEAASSSIFLITHNHELLSNATMVKRMVAGRLTDV